MISFFQKFYNLINHKITQNDPGLYLTIALPVLFAFLLTFIISRLISYLITYGYLPELYLRPAPGLHIHHFAYGIFILAIAGYLALSLNSPKATFLIALLYGLGLGLSFDEMGMWLKLRDDDPVRWSYDGFIIVILTFLLVIFAKPGLVFLKNLLQF